MHPGGGTGELVRGSTSAPNTHLCEDNRPFNRGPTAERIVTRVSADQALEAGPASLVAGHDVLRCRLRFLGYFEKRLDESMVGLGRSSRPEGIFTTAFDAWFTPYGVAQLAIVLVLAGCGFWLSLAGRPFFKDMLAEPKAAT